MISSEENKRALEEAKVRRLKADERLKSVSYKIENCNYNTFETKDEAHQTYLLFQLFRRVVETGRGHIYDFEVERLVQELGLGRSELQYSDDVIAEQVNGWLEIKVPSNRDFGNYPLYKWMGDTFFFPAREGDFILFPDGETDYPTKWAEFINDLEHIQESKEMNLDECRTLFWKCIDFVISLRPEHEDALRRKAYSIAKEFGEDED